MENESGKPNQVWADPNALCNLVLGILLLVLAHTVFTKKMITPEVVIALAPWALMAFFVFLVVVIVSLRAGDIVGATANGLLGVILLGQFFVKGVFNLQMFLYGKAPTPEMTAAGFHVDGIIFLCCGITVLFVGYLAGHMSWAAAVALWAIGAGLICTAIVSFGYLPFLGIVSSYGLLIIGVWFFYSGLAILVNTASRKQILPLGGPLFGRK
jgi:hypothetical protein